ncbi:MAG: helix-hairpin-helix domain-containing protein, partial [Acidimicrobiales bacterium]|nr:helix-hairpin-helix domain-containing protein [Acidimicrobiales bacterium]
INDLRHAVDKNDISVLKNVPGVGKKTADRLLVELKNQLSELLQTNVLGDIATGAAYDALPLAKEAEQALISLGYKPQESIDAVAAALALEKEHNSLSLNDLVRLALRNFIRE